MCFFDDFRSEDETRSTFWHLGRKKKRREGTVCVFSNKMGKKVSAFPEKKGAAAYK